MVRALACLSLLLVAADVAPGQPVPGQPVTLALRPAAAPVPALKFQLLPELRDRTPGNAAVQYLRAFSPEYALFSTPELREKFDQAIMKPREMPAKELREVLDAGALKEVDLAARREFCDWELTGRLRKEGMYMPMADVQGLRRQGQLLALRARFEAADGHHARAVYTLQSGFALARDVGDGPTLINALVGIAIAGTMTTQLEELIQTPGSPNLYWALTNLPTPFIAMRKPLQGERLLVDALFPDARATLADGKLTPLSPQAQQAATGRLLEAFNLMEEGGMEVKNRLGLAVYAARAYPDAKRSLIAAGHPAEQVEALPVVQAVLFNEIAAYDQVFDDIVKWQGLPYWQARPGLEQAEARIRERAKAGTSGMLAVMLAPGLSKAFGAQARIDRRIAALRVVEAVRLHAAANGGRLPAALEEIREVPIPVDPFTGKGFEYQRDGDKVTLTGTAPAGQTANVSNFLQYVFTLAK